MVDEIKVVLEVRKELMDLDKQLGIVKNSDTLSVPAQRTLQEARAAIGSMYNRLGGALDNIKFLRHFYDAVDRADAEKQRLRSEVKELWSELEELRDFRADIEEAVHTDEEDLF